MVNNLANLIEGKFSLFKSLLLRKGSRRTIERSSLNKIKKPALTKPVPVTLVVTFEEFRRKEVLSKNPLHLLHPNSRRPHL